MENRNVQTGREENRGKQGTKGRMINIELMRFVSMLLIVTAHYLGKGNLLPPLNDRELNWTAYLPWILEGFVILSINMYMMITGYFLVSSSFKVSRLIKTVLQVWFYSVTVGIVAGIFGFFPGDGLSGYYILELMFPISMNQYWFMTAYVFMYLFTPFIAIGARQLNKKQLLTVIILLLLAFCVIKSVTPGELETDLRGYDCIWYLCVCIIAAYIRLYGIPCIRSAKMGFLLCLAGAAAIFAETMALRLIYITTGKLESILTISYSFNHVFALIASVGAFVGFEKLRLGAGKLSSCLLGISPYILGVYLLHEHPAIRYRWQIWLGSKYAENGLWLLPWLVLAVCVVFVAGIAADVLRSFLFGVLHRGLLFIPFYRKLADKVRKIDERMAMSDSCHDIAAGNGGDDEKAKP